MELPQARSAQHAVGVGTDFHEAAPRRQIAKAMPRRGINRRALAQRDRPARDIVFLADIGWLGHDDALAAGVLENANDASVNVDDLVVVLLRIDADDVGVSERLIGQVCCQLVVQHAVGCDEPLRQRSVYQYEQNADESQRDQSITHLLLCGFQRRFFP